MRRSGGDREEGGCKEESVWESGSWGPLAGLRGDREVCHVSGTGGNGIVAMWVMSLWLVASCGWRGLQR